MARKTKQAAWKTKVAKTKQAARKTKQPGRGLAGGQWIVLTVHCFPGSCGCSPILKVVWAVVKCLDLYNCKTKQDFGSAARASRSSLWWQYGHFISSMSFPQQEHVPTLSGNGPRWGHLGLMTRPDFAKVMLALQMFDPVTLELTFHACIPIVSPSLRIYMPLDSIQAFNKLCDGSAWLVVQACFKQEAATLPALYANHSLQLLWSLVASSSTDRHISSVMIKLTSSQMLSRSV